MIRHPGAACVLAETEDGKVVLVRQWRYAADQRRWNRRRVSGCGGRRSCRMRLRELAEETPYVADSVKLLYTFYTAVGFCDEKCISTKRKVCVWAAN